MGEAAPELQKAPENPNNETPETLADAGETFAANARFEAAMRRIQAVTGTRTQVELARLLDIRQSSISDAKKRASIPDAWLVRLCVLYDANPAWVLHGDGTPYLRHDTDRAAPDGAPRDEQPEEEPTPKPSVGEMLKALEEHLGNGLRLLVMPPGMQVTIEPRRGRPWRLPELLEHPMTFTGPADLDVFGMSEHVKFDWLRDHVCAPKEGGK